MKNRTKLKIASLIAILVFSVGCEDFLDINDDPNNPLVVPTAQLITAAQANMSYTLSNGSGGLGLYTGTVMKHWVQRGSLNDYGLSGTDFAVVTSWQSFYAGALTDLQVAIAQATIAGDSSTVGAARLMRAHIASTAVDLWGVVPYFEIGQGAGNEAPAFDDGELVYEDVLNLVDLGIASLTASNGGTVAGDVIYGGDADAWIAYGNSLKLRLLNNIRLTRDVAAEVTPLLANVFGSNADDFELSYGTTFNPENRNPGFSFEWQAGGGTRIDPFFYETMRGLDTYGHGGLLPAGAAITDPRIPYYFFNQLPAGSADADAENPCAYCPSRGNSAFLSIFPYSFNIDPNEGFDQGMSSSLAGLYPIGGRFDDGAGGIASNASTLSDGQVTGPGDVAQRLLDYTELLFIRAELAQESVTTEDARALLGMAIEAAFAKVNDVASSAGAPAIADASRDSYRDAVLATYDAATAQGQLEVIMVSKWIAMFGNSIVTYNDARRTGFPRLHDGNTDNLAVTVQTRQFPVSLPYDINNLQLNQSAPSQKVIANDKVFWDVN